MKNSWTHSIVLCLLLALFAAPGYAAVPSEFGARAYGMGGAYTGVASDIASLVYNPAGLTHNTFEIALGVGSNSLQELGKFQSILSEDFDEELRLDLATLGGMSLGRFGAGVAATGSANVELDCASGESLCAEADYMIQLLVGAGFDVGRLPLNLAGLKVGASVARLEGRRLSHTRVNGVDTYDGVTIDQRGKGLGLNLGASFNASDIVTVGLSAQNLLSTVTWTGTRTEGVYHLADKTPVGTPVETALAKETSSLPTVFRAGVAVSPPVIGATLAADVATDGTLRYGIEKSLLFNALNVRAGQIVADGETTTTAGIGLNLGPVHLDLAAGSSDGFKTVGTMLEGSVRF